MARKKKNPELTESTDINNLPPAEKKKPGRKKTETLPENAQPDETQSSQEKPAKKIAKKAASKKKSRQDISEEDKIILSPEQDEIKSATEMSEELQPLKKAAKRKSSAKKLPEQKDETAEAPVNNSESAKEVEHVEPVSVAEEKNELFVHRLASAAEHVTEHQTESKTEPSSPVTEKPVGKLQKHITFVLNYYTKPGQNLFITAHHSLFGNGNAAEALPMEFLDAEHWKAVVPITDLTEEITYHYLLKNEDGSLVYDDGNDKKVSPASYTKNEVVILDVWDYAGYYDNALCTEPFKNVLLKNNFSSAEQPETVAFTHNMKVKAPLLSNSQVVCITGSTDALKNWDTAQPHLLIKNANENVWQIKFDLQDASLPLYYKYGVYDASKKALVHLESGNNRVLNFVSDTNSETIVNDGFIRTADNTWKGAGVAIPVFSLRTENSWGCGEFADIKTLVDWSKLVGLKLIQLLPVNDTTATKTWLDSYPYAAISAFALHAMYLNMEEMVSEENKSLSEKYLAEAKRLNGLPAVDYEAVNDIKWKLIHDVYPLQKETTFALHDYQNFFEDNKHWLEPYAAFCSLRDMFNTADFLKWNEFKKYNQTAISAFMQTPEETEKAGMYYFVQYHLHLQLKEAAAYAHSNGIIIKGDIAIGISRSSADVWQKPELFNLDMQAGAPPDAFAVKGQNWGFPTYNWAQMKEDGFAWWMQRFLQMSNYFDAFRIDHILGFFRIWSIPVDQVEGIMGHFVPALPVHISEFQQWNTYFDYKRYCKPFISNQIINDLFGDQQDFVKEHFLNRDDDNTYSLKPEVETQRRVETYFAIREKNEHNNWLKQTLFDLISNVILFEEEGSNEQLFHFRFGMEKTLSYQHLDDYTKNQLYYLSINYFYERQNEIWRQEALKKLPALKAETDMLICGEDLGLVPASVPRVMQDLGLLSLEVQRMPKDERATFANLEKAPYLSVVTPSTHDMSTIRGWWEEDRNTTQNFYNNQLGQSGEAPMYCEPWINKQIVEQHLYSPAMWSIFLLQDLMGSNGKLRRPDPHKERINVPAIPNYYWQYRMHLSLEDLQKADDFNTELKKSVINSER